MPDHTPFADLAALSADYAQALRAGEAASTAAVRARLTAAAGDHTRVAPARALFQDARWNAAADLPVTAGVYVITADSRLDPELSGPDGATYVGCARNIRDRFFAPRFGHLSAHNNTRSREVLREPQWRVAVVAQATELRTVALLEQLAGLETYWWLLAHAAGAHVVNAESALGRLSDLAGAWLVCCELESGRHVAARGQAEAARLSGVPAGLVAAVAGGWQSQAHGWGFRPATPREVAELRAGGPDAL